jgi:hypothetical protein
MMKKFLLNMFRKERSLTKPPHLDVYFMKEIDSSPYIKDEYKEILLRHFQHKINLHKSGSTLNSEEKKEIGLNTREAISSSFSNILTKDGLSLKKPKYTVKLMYLKATIEHSRDIGFHKAVNAQLRKFTIITTDDKCCSWCKNHERKVFDKTVLEQFKENCECIPYSKTMIHPVVR